MKCVVVKRHLTTTHFCWQCGPALFKEERNCTVLRVWFPLGSLKLKVYPLLKGNLDESLHHILYFKWKWVGECVTHQIDKAFEPPTPTSLEMKAAKSSAVSRTFCEAEVLNWISFVWKSKGSVSSSSVKMHVLFLSPLRCYDSNVYDYYFNLSILIIDQVSPLVYFV